jgi:hypothetical protein
LRYEFQLQAGQQGEELQERRARGHGENKQELGSGDLVAFGGRAEQCGQGSAFALACHRVDGHEAPAREHEEDEHGTQELAEEEICLTRPRPGRPVLDRAQLRDSDRQAALAEETVALSGDQGLEPFLCRLEGCQRHITVRPVEEGQGRRRHGRGVCAVPGRTGFVVSADHQVQFLGCHGFTGFVTGHQHESLGGGDPGTLCEQVEDLAGPATADRDAEDAGIEFPGPGFLSADHGEEHERREHDRQDDGEHDRAPVTQYHEQFGPVECGKRPHPCSSAGDAPPVLRSSALSSGDSIHCRKMSSR